jgi:hypothetical protein
MEHKPAVVVGGIFGESLSRAVEVVKLRGKEGDL